MPASFVSTPSPSLPDHVHILVTAAIDVSTSRCVQFIKGGYSYALPHKTPGGVWHSGYHEHRIRDEDDFRAQLLYIANNPVRKRLQDYPLVHTASRYSSQLDLVPKVTEPPALSSRPLELLGNPSLQARASHEAEDMGL